MLISRCWLLLLLAVASSALGSVRQSTAHSPGQTVVASSPNAALPATPATAAGIQAGQAEAKLIEAYKLVGAGRIREALGAVDALVAEHPNFKLALLLQGDLLAALTRPVGRFGDVSEPISAAKAKELEAFRQEALSRLQAFRDLPPPGRFPKEFLRLPPSSRHAIAVDAARSRLYLFENNPRGLRLVAHYYVSLGLAGIAKRVEGDQRTPLGVYFITGNLSPKGLGDLYGSGALPINYPNELDKRRGRTGSGIWLHGMPSDTFARPVNATDGCIALANPDLEKILTTVRPGTTPVLISRNLDWVTPEALTTPRSEFDAVIEAWRQARIKGDTTQLQRFYAPDFRSTGRDRGQFARHSVVMETTKVTNISDKPRRVSSQKTPDPQHQAVEGDFQMRDVSYLSWVDERAQMIVTFTEVARSGRQVNIRRQYWQREPNSANGWMIYFEGVIG